MYFFNLCNIPMLFHIIEYNANIFKYVKDVINKRIHLNSSSYDDITYE